MVTASEAAAPTTSAKGLSDKDAFMTQFDDVVTLLMDDIKTSFDLPAEALTYVRRVITYNVPHGKLNRGLAVYQCYKAFHPTGAVAAEEAYNANLLGWCVELLQAFFLVADDIMDNSHTRRGQPCFFRLEDVGLNAVNDAIIIEMMLYRILRLRFAGHPSYIHLLDLFQDISYTTEMGQMLDLTSQKPGVVDLDRFSEAVLARIYKYKTSHYTFYLPVALGMRLAGVDNEAAYTTAKEICLEMGHYFQAQDDYLDCFGDPEVIGKVGTDIEENTCTWMIVQALKHVSPEQRSLLDKNYGKKEKEHVDVVKQIYRDIDLPQKFAQFEQDSYVTLRKMIDEVDNMPTGAFEFLLGKIHKRDK